MKKSKAEINYKNIWDVIKFQKKKNQKFITSHNNILKKSKAEKKTKYISLLKNVKKNHLT